MKLLGSLVAAMSLALVGCGGDDDDKLIEEVMSFENGDGGEIRIENLVFPDGVSRTLLTAHFFNAQTGKMDFPIVNTEDAPLECNWVGGSGGEGSVENPSPSQIYPFGDDDATVGSTATFAPGGRNYLDVGANVTLQAAGKDAITLVKYTDHVTPFTGGSFHPIVYDPPASDDPTLAVVADLMGGDGANVTGAELNVTLAGSDEVPETHWDFDGTFSGIEIPPRPVIDGFSQLGMPSATDITRGEDLTLEYDVPAAADPDLLGFVAIFQTSPSFEITHICLHTHPGKVIIPAAIHDQMAPSGVMFVAHLYHRLRTLDNERRVDMVGTACTSTAYTLVDPA